MGTSIPADYPGWMFRLSVPKNSDGNAIVTNDSSSRSDDENGNNLEGVQLLAGGKRNTNNNYELSHDKNGEGLRYLAELCPHGVSINELSKDSAVSGDAQKSNNQVDNLQTKWSWSFSSKSCPSQWNVTSSNLLAVTYRPAHEAHPSYTNISKQREIWHRSVGACFEKGGLACNRMVCRSSNISNGSKKKPRKKRSSHKWSKLKRLVTGAPKPIHRIKVNYTVEDISSMETIVASPIGSEAGSASSSFTDGETGSSSSAGNTGLWIRGVGYCHALRIFLRPKFGSCASSIASNGSEDDLVDTSNNARHNHDAGFELPPLEPWDNSPSPPWGGQNNAQRKGESDEMKYGPMITFAIPYQKYPLDDKKQSFHIDKCPPLLWKIDHPPNPNVAIDSFSLMEGKLDVKRQSTEPTNVYINGYQSWSFSGSVVQGEPQPKSAMPKIFSEAFNRGGVVLSSSSRHGVSTDEGDDCWVENAASGPRVVGGNITNYSNITDEDNDLNEENSFYKSDMFACISSNGANPYQINDERVILDEEGGPALILGFLAQRHQFGVVLMDQDLRRFNLFACHEGIVASQSSASTSLNGRSSLTTDWAYCQIVDSSCYDEEAMVYYVHATSDHNDARPMEKGLTTGWCSWYHYYSDIDHDSLSKNAHILEKHQSNIGFNVCLIDDGYMTSWGDWNSLKPGKFLKDGGMKVLADAIRAKGMKPGVWLAPFACDKDSKLAKEHPDWIIRNDRGRIANSANCGKFFYGLDATNPEVRKHVYDTIRRAVTVWGFEVLKLDFLYASCLAGNGKYDNTMSRAEAMYLGFRTIRAAAPDAFIIGCGSPIGSALGFVDGMRVSCDTGPTWVPPPPLPWWDNGTLPALRGMLRNTMSRAPLGHRWWHNDPDCILLGESTKLSDSEVVSAASIVAMSGGMFLLSDDMEKVSPARLAVAKKIFPLTGVTAVPLDLHSTHNSGMPSILRAWCSEDATLVDNGVEEARDIPSPRMLREQASKLECEVGYSPGMIIDPYSRERSCFGVVPGLGTWTVVSLSNWMDHSAKLSVSFSALVGHSYQDFVATGSARSKGFAGTNSSKTGSGTPGEQSESGFHVFSFWSSQYSWIPHQTLVDNNPLVKRLGAHETEIFHIKPANPTRPQYIGSDLHFTCGFEVRSFEWSERNVLIKLKIEYEKKGSVFIYLPAGRTDAVSNADERLKNLLVVVNGKSTGSFDVIAKPTIGVHSGGSDQPTHYHHGRVVKVQVAIEASSDEENGHVSLSW